MSYPDYSVDEVFGVLHQTDNICLYNSIFFSDSCFSNSLKNIYVNIYAFRNENLYQPQDDSHLHYKSVQVVAAEPHSIAWEPLLFLINSSSPNLELCREGNQFQCNTIQKFVPALRWSTSPKGNQKSTIKCQRLQCSLQCLRLCCKTPTECWFLPLFPVKLFQRSYFPLHVKQKKDFKRFSFQGRKPSYYYTFDQVKILQRLHPACFNVLPQAILVILQPAKTMPLIHPPEKSLAQASRRCNMGHEGCSCK